MKILPQERLGYELGWLVSKMAGSKKRPWKMNLAV